MRHHIFTYLKKKCSAQPLAVDRLIISAYFHINNIKIENNIFLKEYIISDNEIEEYEILINFTHIIKKEIKEFNIEELIELFEFVVSPADRIVNGAVYTPLHIRNYICESVFHKKETFIDQIKVADISCGCGGFLYNAAKMIKEKTNKTYYEIFENHIFGLDIQDYSITRTKLLLTILAVSKGEDFERFHFNLFIGDALTFKWNEIIPEFLGFDAILGNPPYVCSRHLSEETKERLENWSVCKSGHPDLYIPFFQIGIENLATQGMLGFITMNSFFKSLNGRALREYFQDKSLAFNIIDFGTEQIFKSRNTYTCICFIENTTRNFISYLKLNKISTLKDKPDNFHQIDYKCLNFKKGWNLQNNEIISKIESIGTPFGRFYETRNGIATLKNDVYIFKPISEDENFYYFQNGNIYPIEKNICREIVNSNKTKNIQNLSQIKEKVIFPYTNDVKPKLLDEVTLREEFPMAYEYLKCKKGILAKRDKEKRTYENWFAFGRSQSLEKKKYKLFFPQLTDHTPNFLISSDFNLLFYNGLALVGESKKELVLAKKIMESKIFWYYIVNTSKPYSSSYYSLSNNYTKHFGVCDLTEEEIDFIIKENNQKILDDFFEEKYGVIIPEQE